MVVLLAISFTLLGIGIAYLIWIIRAGLKQKWRTFTILIAIPFILTGLFCLWGWGYYHFKHARYLNGLFDAKVTLGSSVYSYESERAFNGDGYSIAVYPLPQGIRERFASPDNRLLTEFPKRPEYRSRWKTVCWRQAPFDDSLGRFLEFALPGYDSERAKGLAHQYDAIKAALRKPATFYAFFYNDPGKYVGDIDLFIVDLEAGKLYLINHNT